MKANHQHLKNGKRKEKRISTWNDPGAFSHNDYVQARRGDNTPEKNERNKIKILLRSG
jgi:hypothetical protein